MEDYRIVYLQKLQSARQAVELVRSGDRVFIGLVNSIPGDLADALWERRGELREVEIQSGNCLVPTPLYLSREENPFSISSPFLGPGERAGVKSGRPLRFTSFHLSQVDLWMRSVAAPTMAFFEVSPPDENGFMSYGPSGCCINAYAAECADRIVVQVNPNTPYITGEKCLIHLSEVDAVVESDRALPALGEEETDPVTRQISAHILPLIPDGATVQLGIGNLSTAIGYGLRERNDLGIFSEMFCEPMMHLIREGNVTNARKGFMDGISVFAFALGSRELYRYLDRNQALYCGTFPFVNDPRNIAKNKRMISINSAMSVDLYGQVAADSMGWSQHSAVGGQIDFVTGAQWSEGGKSIIATSSSFVKDGVRRSKIVLSFPAGTAVTTPRSDVQYVATEYGCVNLKELAMSDRVRAMISLAHPDFRDQLTEEAKAKRLI